MLVYLLLALFLTCNLGILVESLHTYSRRNSTGLTDEVTWDPYSLSIYGQRVFILAAEVHPWRIPGDPAIWADIFQKVKANGFNTVSFYVNWALHYPVPDTNGGRGDFEEGTYRDIQGFIDQAKKAGLWMIARPGPYINGETTGGGFPGWVGNIAGNLRSNNPNYTEAWTPYLTSISKIIAKNQITNGGPIILVQAENEYSESAGNDEYMQAIIDLYRDNGIVIPTTHNDQHSGQAGNFSPDRPGLGRVNIYWYILRSLSPSGISLVNSSGDSYPQGSNRWAQVQSIYYSAHKAVAPSNPLCLAEFGGGFLLQWGSVTPRGGTGYEKYSNANGLTDATYDIYMLFGGTNWGQTAAPVSYTSYDYGGGVVIYFCLCARNLFQKGINENRVANTKMNEMRLQGLFLRVSRDLLSSDLIANSTNYTTSSLIHTAELRNPITGAAFYVTRHNDSTSTELTTTQIRVNTSQGSLLIPQTGVLTFNGRESKIIVTDYVFGRSSTTILYSTAEIMTWTTIGDTDYLILYAPEGQTGETAFLLSTELKVSNLQDAPGASATLSDGRLTLQYTLKGSQSIPIQLQSTKFVVILLDKATAYQWHAPIIEGSGTFGNFFSIGTNETVLVGGPYVLRSSSLSGNTLELTGDLNGTTSVEFIAPSSISRLSWNGKDIPISKSSRGTFVATIQGAKVGINLPTLGDWKVSGSLPEIEPDFDDSQFVLADIRTTNYTNLPPLFGDVVLYSQQYGFYGGNLIFRGHFEASGDETTVKLAVQYGFAGGYTAWLNGVFLGSGQGNSTVSLSEDSWAIPANTLQVGKDNVLVVVQDHTGISETSTNGGKEPRGIRGYAIEGGNATFTLWRLQGNQGGAANTPDTYRGYLNEGGLYAERIGAHLPGYPDVQWKNGTPLSGGGLSRAGINFYRTTFDLRVPDSVDFPIRLSITPSDISSNFRVQIYLNGWQVGKYINNIGPQTDFVLPASVLRRSSTNTLSLSLWSLDNSGASITGLKLISDGIFSTSFVFNDYRTPDYIEQQKNRPSGTYYEPM
ncbi:related to Probable beta-galactosidase C [Armillaria ostoyae]|uniref:Beta-galactosidase n=1 Tax=Armillaria ostoyae TaxID=47428 RepID=A0A284R5W9_ARMOS|nr:related to Probable beta-galactosidase C [Armillaria ostoyae]